MFNSKRKGKLFSKLFVITIIALFVYGYILDEENMDYFKNLYSKNEPDSNEMNDPNNESQNADSAKDEDPNTINPVNQPSNNLKTLSSDTKLIFKTYNNDNNEISTQELDIPKDLINLSIDDAKVYIAENYSNWIVNDINQDYIEVFKTSQQDVFVEPYYLIKETEGKIYIYEFNEKGEQKMVQETNIVFNLLSESDQALFKDGIVKYDMEEVTEIMQDFES